MADEAEDQCSPNISEAPLNCATCAQIIEIFGRSTDGSRLSLGCVSSLIDTECPHGEWIKNFRPDISEVEGFSESIIMAKRYKSAIQLSFNRDGLCWLGRHSELVYRKSTSRPDIGRARLLDPGWIDEGVILNWKDMCNGHHGDECEHPEELRRLDSARPMWLIDTAVLVLFQDVQG